MRSHSVLVVLLVLFSSLAVFNGAVIATTATIEDSITSTSSSNDAGIEIGFTQSSFTNVFSGLFGIVHTAFQNDHFSLNKTGFTLSIDQINLTEFSLNTASSKTTFLSNKALRIELNLNKIEVDFHYQLNFLSKYLTIASGVGSFVDSNASIHIDVAITQNRTESSETKPVTLKISNLLIQFGSSSISFNPKHDNYLANLVNHKIESAFDSAQEFLNKIHIAISLAAQAAISKFNLAIPTVFTIPNTSTVLDMSTVAPAFIQNGYLRIPINGNSYQAGTSTTPLQPYHEFDFNSEQIQSSQIFIDQVVLERLLQNIFFNETAFNATLPQSPSSTTPVDSRSLSAVLPKLRNLRSIYYPIVEIMISSESLQVEFINNRMIAHVNLSVNLYFELPNNDKSLFKYNVNPVGVVFDIEFDFIASNNYLTPNFKKVTFVDIVATEQDAANVNVSAIRQVFPFLNQLLGDALNLAVYSSFIDISKLVGFDVQEVAVHFDEHNIHLEVLF